MFIYIYIYIYIYRLGWMLQTPLIQLTQMCKIRMQMQCKVLQIKTQGPTAQNQAQGPTVQNPAQGPTNQNQAQVPAVQIPVLVPAGLIPSSRSHTGWSKYTCPTTTTTGPHTTWPLLVL